MITERIDRHAKPHVTPIEVMLRVTPQIQFVDEVFTDSKVQAKMNEGLFDVIAEGGRVLDRCGNANGPAYSQIGGRLVVSEPGQYLLRTYNNVHDQDEATVKVDAFTFSDGSRMPMGVRFWPEILTQPAGGAARLSQDQDGISVIVHRPGRYAFMYRMRNYLGQVSESACVYVTAVA